jgi:hypothetical protein
LGGKLDGLCCLSGISRNLLGGGEGVEIIEQNDDWILRGVAQQETQFEAMVIQFEKVKK